MSQEKIKLVIFDSEW